MNDQLYKKEQQAYIRYANETRGLVINHTILLERIMDECIAGYFFKNSDTRTELIEVLISSETLTYSSKVNLFVRLLKKIYTPEVFIKKYVGMAKELQEIATDRNKFAHQIIVLDLTIEDFHKTAICLVDFKEMKTGNFYSPDKIKEIIDKVRKYVKIIDQIKQDITGIGNPREVVSENNATQ